MPAKFVNLIEFFELEIFLQMKAIGGDVLPAITSIIYRGQ